jgi:hypothetical protein
MKKTPAAEAGVFFFAVVLINGESNVIETRCSGGWAPAYKGRTGLFSITLSINP